MNKESKCCNRISYFLKISFLENNYKINYSLIKKHKKCLALKNLGKKFEGNCFKYEKVILKNIHIHI